MTNCDILPIYTKIIVYTWLQLYLMDNNNISHEFDNTLSQDPQRPRVLAPPAPRVLAPPAPPAPRVLAPPAPRVLAPWAHNASLISMPELSFISWNLLLENELEISIFYILFLVYS